MKINVNSEIGELEGVIIHTPGPEIENMTPQNAERALYSDILNLNVVNKEYSQFKNVLKKVTKVFEVSDLLKKVLSNQSAKIDLVKKICNNENSNDIIDKLIDLPAPILAKQLIEGVPLIAGNLTKYLSDERYELQPLHNFFFMRDASISLNDEVLIANPAKKVREREAIIMEAIFKDRFIFDAKIVNLNPLHYNTKVNIEGGDILIVRDDILLIGHGTRTTTQGIDLLIDHYKSLNKKMNIIVQVLPTQPESFIHLDMVFTILDYDKCLIYEPVIFNQHDFQTVNIFIDNGEVTKICEEKNILQGLSKLGIDLQPIYCGGRNDEWIQEREQWHSGANFFALGPGKILGYGRNNYTIEEINKNGFEVLKAKDVISGKVNLKKYDSYVITIEGSELARGGGGCRCMTMPVSRKHL